MAQIVGDIKKFLIFLDVITVLPGIIGNAC